MSAVKAGNRPLRALGKGGTHLGDHPRPPVIGKKFAGEGINRAAILS